MDREESTMIEGRGVVFVLGRFRTEIFRGLGRISYGWCRMGLDLVQDGRLPSAWAVWAMAL